MSKANLLIEIGVEEVPAGTIAQAVAFMEDSFRSFAGGANLAYSDLAVHSTPRRFVLDCRDLDKRQQDRSVHITGPSVNIAYKEDGSPSPALLGFLKKNGAELHELVRESGNKGEIVALDRLLPGSDTGELIVSWLSQLLPQIPFPKKMIWNEHKLGFIRPLRWILALWNGELLPMEAYGLKSSLFTRANRYKGLDKLIQIDSLEDYYTKLAEGAVIVDRTERRSLLAQGMNQLFENSDALRIQEDPALVELVTDLVEYPVPVIGHFDESFLALPDKVISSTISQNQKYFSVLDQDAKLTSSFVFVSNGDPAHSDLIKQGNEKVVKARLADALWYFEEDCAHKLEDYLPKLSEIVFQSKLGTMQDKARRVMKLAGRIAELLGLEADSIDKATRAAQLCKADLVTNMLGEKEFTKLQGYMGKQYALKSGEDAEVAEAIYEHYMPRGQRDALPTTVTGAIVAIADKLDTVSGIISVGMMPTGSGDPFALRRAANGIVQILADRDWDLDLYQLVKFALSQIREDAETVADPEDLVMGFLQARLSWLLQQLGIDYDVADSLLYNNPGKVADLKHRALALQAFRNRDDFIRLVIGFKRVANIIGLETVFADLNPALFSEPAEKTLYERFISLQESMANCLASYNYKQAINELVAFGAYIDSFFDDVLVNTDDEALRLNRYSLLNQIKTEFLQLADISLLVVEQA